MEIKIVLYERSRITMEVTPIVVIGEAGGCDPRPRREGAKLFDFRLVERTIYRLKFIVLVFAQNSFFWQPDIPLSTWSGCPESSDGTLSALVIFPTFHVPVLALYCRQCHVHASKAPFSRGLD